MNFGVADMARLFSYLTLPAGMLIFHIIHLEKIKQSSG